MESFRVVKPVIGEVYMMQFDGYGGVQKGWRPGVVLQNNVGNVNSPNVIALPLTSVIKKLNMPTHVMVWAKDSGLTRDSMVLCENPETIAKTCIGQYLTILPDEYMRQIAFASSVATAAISYLDVNDLYKAWQLAVRLNSAVESIM